MVARSSPPQTPAEWLELPGVGPYTAAAITSIAFREPVACVDGNVVRILARLTADETPFRDSATAAKVFTPLASALVPAAEPGDHNQAMMELGATVCVRQNPLCLTCPVRKFCAGASHDKFIVVIETADPKFNTEETRKLLASAGSKHIELVED